MAALSAGVEALLKRDRYAVIAGLAAVVAAAWIYTVAGVDMSMSAVEMTGLSDATHGIVATAKRATVSAMAPVTWSPAHAVVVFFMWWIMMVAMMLPSAAPTVLLYAVVNRKNAERGRPFVPTAVFAAGYLVAWGGFSLIAAGLQWALERVALISPMMATTSVLFGGVLLIAAGVYQLTPLKYACLRHCRSPLQFLATSWRPGRRGAFLMGLEHGVFCLGCCWVLMALLFYGGVMNLYWVAGLAVYVLVEKLAPLGHRLGRAAGVGLVAWGAWVVFAAI